MPSSNLQLRITYFIQFHITPYILFFNPRKENFDRYTDRKYIFNFLFDIEVMSAVGTLLTQVCSRLITILPVNGMVHTHSHVDQYKTTAEANEVPLIIAGMLE